jgi:hypothetical protein
MSTPRGGGRCFDGSAELLDEEASELEGVEPLANLVESSSGWSRSG